MTWLLFAAAGLLAITSIGCFKVGNWHSQEAAYWNDVARRVRLTPAIDVQYRPILRWAQANRPSVWRRLKPWLSPEDRMHGADA